jgi:glyoxylase I family protein
MRVSLGHADIGMPHDLLDDAQVHSLIDHDFHLEILAGPGAAARDNLRRRRCLAGRERAQPPVPVRGQRGRHPHQLRRRSVDIVNPPFEIEDISARLAFFRDPWCNMFELSESLSRSYNH